VLKKMLDMSVPTGMLLEKKNRSIEGYWI
jgi:hypothetical protein